MLIWNRFKKIIVNIAIVLAFFSLIWGAVQLVGSDIPSLIRGYEEIPIEYIEDENWMGITQIEVSETVKKEITAEEGISRIIDTVILIILSGALLIAAPEYKKNEE